MDNFTKSIVYSGVVLAAGLVSIFAIYNNMTPDRTGLSNIQPSSGKNCEELYKVCKATE